MEPEETLYGVYLRFWQPKFLPQQVTGFLLGTIGITEYLRIPTRLPRYRDTYLPSRASDRTRR